MIHSLFSLPVYKVNLLNRGIDLDKLKEFLYPIFQETFAQGQEVLEKEGGNSTYNWNHKLHQYPELEEINRAVLEHAKIYWRVLDINQQLSPKIDMCWSNLHRQGSYTDLHSHSPLPMVGTFYVQAEEGAGNLILINPMEYSITHLPINQIQRKIETPLVVRTGDLVLFPGWLRHKTSPNLSKSNRIVVSYNLTYEGKHLQNQVDYPQIDYTYQESQQVFLPSDNGQINDLMKTIAEQEFIINELSKHLIK